MAAVLALLGTASLLLLGPPKGSAGPTQTYNGSTSHSLRYFRTSVSQPGQGLPQFFIVGYLDDQLFYQYDSNSRKARPRVTWMEKAGEDYWDTETQWMRGREVEYRTYMASLRNHYNQSEEFHTLQKMYGCELRKDGSIEGYAKYAYDGTDHIILDKESPTWMAADGSAQISKKEWENTRTPAHTCKVYLEEECIKRLEKFLNYGKEALLRTEPPVGKITRQAIGGDQEALICQAYGFYPKEIETTWRKGEEILDHETFRRSIAPNSDGTYHTWLSIEIDPKERNLYQCHVDHDSLQKPLVLTFEEPGVSVGLIIVAIFVVAAFLLAAGITTFFLKNRHKRGGYKAASTPSDKSSDSSIMGSSSHSLRHFCTSMSEPGQGLPQFISVGYVDDQVICQYDSNSRTVRRRVAWMEKADAHYWDAQTQIMRGKEAEFRADMVTLRKRYNQSDGFHTWQEMSSCELRKDGSKGGHLQYAYDGRDFISLDLETLTWTAADVPAQTTKREWEAEPSIAKSSKVYLEEDCTEWLQKFLDYGKEMLQRIQRPKGKVTCQTLGDGQEVFICQAHGFYPKEVEATWRKGAEILEHETFRRNIAPNSDGTYHIWLSIEIDPKQRDLYRCHVDHASLAEPLVLALEEPGVNMGIFVGPVVAVAILLAFSGIICCFLRASDNSSDSSIRATQNNSDRSIEMQRPSASSSDFVRINPQLLSP